MKLTYSLIYTPSRPTNDVNFICSDNKVHIRFNNFDRETFIGGFERKLTYLLTYLINYSYLPKVVGTVGENNLIEVFLKTSDIATINNCIKLHYNLDNFKGIKLKENYKKKNKVSFGAISELCFPLVYDNDIAVAGNLESFLKLLDISLEDYLFNDAYCLSIHQVITKDMNKKFNNKQIRKANKSYIENNYVELW